MRNSKLKLLYLADIFKKETDEEHPLSAEELCTLLSQKDISAERKAIYRDIDVLKEYGMDIIKQTSPKRGWFLGEHEYELAEVRLLSDAVSSAAFISPKKTGVLLDKIGNMSSVYQNETLKDQVYVSAGIKSGNEEIFYTIDKLQRAIEDKKCARLQYSNKYISGNGDLKSEDRTFTISPYAMIWSEDHYYLICNIKKYNDLMHLRIDKIKKVEILDTDSRPLNEVSDFDEKFDSPKYTARVFKMFTGEEIEITLVCENSIIDYIIDRFGSEIRAQRVDDNHFQFTTKAAFSDGLVSYIMQYGPAIRVVSPTALRKRIINKANSIVNNYTKPSLLLHSCCAPCSSGVITQLTDDYNVTVFYYNPNTYPNEEYEKRKKEQIRYLAALKERGYHIDYIEGDYDPSVFFEAVKGHEDDREGEERCHICYELRMRETAKKAAENSFDYFTTTMSVSPHKDAAALNKIGAFLAKEFKVAYLYSDFKKHDGFKKSIDESKRYNLYRQNYCGCKYSLDNE